MPNQSGAMHPGRQQRLRRSRYSRLRHYHRKRRVRCGQRRNLNAYLHGQRTASARGRRRRGQPARSHERRKRLENLAARKRQRRRRTHLHVHLHRLLLRHRSVHPRELRLRRRRRPRSQRPNHHEGSSLQRSGCFGRNRQIRFFPANGGQCFRARSRSSP